MRKAVTAARRGLGATYPNPCVGAVVVTRGGRVCGTGRSAPTGGPHAERRALAAAGRAARGGTLYVTLEPCRHHGRTPPCTDAILEAGIARVVVGVVDPATHARGRGLARLRRRGVEVVTGIAGPRCRGLHEHYLHHESTGRPFVTLKIATSLDGRIATASGDSRWITGDAARRHVHRQRAEHHAIVVGVGTVLADDPKLTVRHVRGVDPQPVIFDSRLRLGAPSAPTRHLVGPGTVVVHTSAASARAAGRLRDAGVELVRVAGDRQGRPRVAAALDALGRRAIRSLLVEGGGRLLGAFVRAGQWQRWLVYQAPVVLGEGRPMVAGLDITRVSEAPRVAVVRRRRLGEDQLTVFAPARPA